MDAALRRRGLRLASNQVEFSLLRTMPQRVGLLARCRELGVVPLALLAARAGPPEREVLRRQPTSERPHVLGPPHGRGRPVVAELRRIGAGPRRPHPDQVALAWLIAKGAVPIPGAKNRAQAEQNAGALGWRMLDETGPPRRGRPLRHAGRRRAHLAARLSRGGTVL